MMLGKKTKCGHSLRGWVQRFKVGVFDGSFSDVCKCKSSLSHGQGLYGWGWIYFGKLTLDKKLNSLA